MNTVAATIAERLVERLLPMRPRDIPPAILARTALCFEDTIGVALAALGCGEGTAGVKLARSSGTGPATVWGAAFSAPTGDAILANGMLSHALDFDDLHAASVMHSSAVVVPTAVALAEQLDASPQEMLAAAVSGYEVAARLGRLAPGSFQRHGFQSTSVLGTFAAAMVAAKLLRLDRDQAISALGIAGSMAGGLMEFLANGSAVKQMHPGWVAQAGIRAARLAQVGMRGPATVFEGRFGVFKSFAREEVDAQLVDAAIGTPWEVELMAPKPYPACLCVHPQVQAILMLRLQGHVGPQRIDDIREIACDVPELYGLLVYEPRARKDAPASAYEGRFSAPFCIARALLDGRLDVSSFGEEARGDPRAHAIAAKVTYQVQDLSGYPESFPARLRVTYETGETHVAGVAHHLGSPHNPMRDDQLSSKFLSCAMPIVGDAAALALQEALRELPVAGDSARFFAALRASSVQETPCTAS